MMFTVPATAVPAPVFIRPDSDTSTFGTGQGLTRTREAEFDATIIHRPYGIAARDMLRSMIRGRDVYVEQRGRRISA